MSDLSDIYNIETTIEENIATSARANGFDNTFTRKNGADDFQKIRPRLEIKATIGQHNGHFALCPDGNERHDQSSFTVEAQIVTEPQNDSDSNILHGLYRAKVRDFLATLAQATWADTTNWPTLAIAEALTENRTDNTPKPQDGLEYSLASFSGVIAVRFEAWAAVLT